MIVEYKLTEKEYEALVPLDDVLQLKAAINLAMQEILRLNNYICIYDKRRRLKKDQFCDGCPIEELDGFYNRNICPLQRRHGK